MNAKRKGTRNEHKSRRLLETAGYAVTRAAGSCPPNCKRLVHVWHDRQRWPEVQKL